MDKWMKSFLFVLFGMMIPLAFTACGDGDDSDGDDGGGGSGGYEQEIGSASQLQGVWTGISDDQEKAIVMGFADSGAGLMQQFNYSYSAEEYVAETSDYVYFEYSYNPYGGKLDIRYTSGKSGSERWIVKSMSSEKMVVKINNVEYICEKYQDDGSGNGSTTDYAPSNVAEKHIHIGLHSYSLDLYFQSNYSVDMKYSKMTTPFTLVSASYAKNGTNSATITYTWTGSTGTFTKTVDLTFTSEDGGTAKGEAVSGTFSIEDFSRSSTAEAPTSIAYMTLHVPYATDTWFKFGAQTGNTVAITSYSGTIRYEKIYATYQRTSTTTATIIVYESFSSYTSTKQEKYSLDFYTSTSGKYSFYSNNGSYGTSQWTGNFTLQ